MIFGSATPASCTSKEMPPTSSRLASGSVAPPEAICDFSLAISLSRSRSSAFCLVTRAAMSKMPERKVSAAWPSSSSSWPFFSMNAGTPQLKVTISPSTLRRIGTPTACTSRRRSPFEAQ